MGKNKPVAVAQPPEKNETGGLPPTGVRVREAREEDVPEILRIFTDIYGAGYPYAGFTDEHWLKRAVFNDHMLMLVAEDTAGGRLLGTASVVFDIGANSDLIGELGRLAVHEDARGHGVGKRLMQGRIEAIRNRLHVAVVENRTPHTFSQRISLAFEFAPVGFLPLKRLFAERESIALFARYFGGSLDLRRNNPRVVPEVHELAHLVLGHCGLPLDVIVDEEAQPYPHADNFILQDLTAEGVPALIRIERGRIRNREVFGPMRLQYGFFKLTAKHASYLLAFQPAPSEGTAAVAGAVGYIHDEVEKSVRVFELIAPNDRAIRYLLEQLLERCRTELAAEYVEIDVSAHAPRMQRTLVELGFLPVAYVPAMVFHRVERLDVVKMALLLIPPKLGRMDLTPGMAHIEEVVMRRFRRQAVLPEVVEALHQLHLLRGLSREQSLRVAGACSVSRFQAGEVLFDEGSPAKRVYVLLEGSVDVARGPSGRVVGQVGVGESLGEVALLLAEPHSATATARGAVTAAHISRDRFAELTRQRPDIGTVLFRNLAEGLGGKLQRLDQEVAADRLGRPA